MKYSELKPGTRVIFHRPEERYTDGKLLSKAFDQPGVVVATVSIDFQNGIWVTPIYENSPILPYLEEIP